MQLPRWVVLASLSSLVWVSLAGCENPVSLGARCQSGSSCAAGLRCEFGRCRAQCEGANDCPSGALCIGEPGVCTLTTDTCDAECAPGLICAGTICAIPCSEAIGCRGGSICDDDTAVCVSTATLDAGLDGGPDGGMDAPVIEALDAPSEDTPALDAPDAVSTDGGALTEPHRAMCVGYAHACAIRDGKVYCWGGAHSGQLGDSATGGAVDHDGLCGPWDCLDHPERPVRRSTGAGTTVLDDVFTISCGIDTTCAVRTGGSVWCWGGTGEVVGHGGSSARADNVILGGATSVEVGRNHACARVDGTWQCWGINSHAFSADGGVVTEEDARLGSLGPSTIVPRVANLFEGASDLALGGLFTCRAGAEGVRCLGVNEANVTGSDVGGADPVGRVVGGLPSVLEDLSAGVAHACAASGGDVFCWGGDLYGALATSAPACPVPGLVSFCRRDARPVDRGFDVRSEVLVSLSRGPGDTTCAITAEGRALCWGWNSYGQAGIENPPTWFDIRVLTSFVSTAPDVPLEGITSVGCGAASCCADTSSGVYCWGENDFGQLGNGTSDSLDVDGAVPDGGSTLAIPHPYATPVDFSRITP